MFPKIVLAIAFVGVATMASAQQMPQSYNMDPTTYGVEIGSNTNSVASSGVSHSASKPLRVEGRELIAVYRSLNSAQTDMERFNRDGSKVCMENRFIDVLVLDPITNEAIIWQVKEGYSLWKICPSSSPLPASP